MRRTERSWWTDGIFEGRSIREVLAARDIGGVFRFLKTRGWSRAAIAGAAGLSETRVRSVAQGKQQIASYDVLERIAAGLDIERGLLGLAYTDAASEPAQIDTEPGPYHERHTGAAEIRAVTSQSQVHDGRGDLPAGHDGSLDALSLSGLDEAGEYDVKRRTVLGTLTGLALGNVTPVALEAVGHGLSYATGSDHADWDNIAADYGVDYYAISPAEMIQRLRIDLTVLQHQIVATSSTDLLRVAGQLSTIMAMSLAAIGQLGLSRRWWRRARCHADESGDVDTQVLVRAWEVTSGGYERRPLPQLIELADEAVAMAADRPTAAVAGLYAGRAQALAIAGRYDEAIASAHMVEAVSDRIPAAVTAEVESLWGWPEHRTLHTFSYVYTEAGDDDSLVAATAVQERALALYPPSLARLRTQVGMHQASRLIQQRHIADGLRHAADLLDELPREKHNAVLYEVGRRVLHALPAEERHRVEATDLRERLEASPAA
ncbi:helix-turn-helix transcriptional regulator [Actinomycetes bacterium KLBMP 9797]